MSTNYVHTLGDSTLDNIYWMFNNDGSNAPQAKERCVEGQLLSKLNEASPTPYEVESHAYDGFTTSSVLNGDTVGRVLPGRADRGVKAAYLAAKSIKPGDSSVVHPLNKLKEAINAKPNATHYVVISVGGNDFRERLGNPFAMLQEIPRIHERYLNIVKEVKSIKDRNIRPILMFQYRLDIHHDHYSIYVIAKVIGYVFAAIHTVGILGIGLSSVAVLAQKINAGVGLVIALISAAALVISHQVMPVNVTKNILLGQDVRLAALAGLMETFYSPILEQARADGLPILDLPNTFNPNDSNLYVSQIEPSQKGGKLIAAGINHIVKHHDFSARKSVLYSKRAQDAAFTGVENRGPKSWSVA